MEIFTRTKPKKTTRILWENLQCAISFLSFCNSFFLSFVNKIKKKTVRTCYLIVNHSFNLAYIASIIATELSNTAKSIKKIRKQLLTIKLPIFFLIKLKVRERMCDFYSCSKISTI